MYQLINFQSAAFIGKCFSMLNLAGMVLTSILIMVVFLISGYDFIHIHDGAITEWWRHVGDEDTWKGIYLWMVQLVFIKITELIADIYYQAKDKIVLNPKVVLAYTLSVGTIMIINTALLITLISE